MEGRKQFDRLENQSSEELPVSRGVPQGSLLGSFFSIFIKDLPEIMGFTEPSIFPVDLKILYNGNSTSRFQLDISNIEKLITNNKMDLASDKCPANFQR